MELYMDEMKIRKNWLQALIAFFGVNFVIGIAGIALSFFVPDAIFGEEGIFMILGLLLAPLVGAGTPYYFAYKKGGTKLIGFITFTMPISMTVMIGSAFMADVEMEDAATRVILLPLMAYYWWNCLQLYKLNRWKKRMVAA